MKIPKHSTLVGFLVALATLSVSGVASAKVPAAETTTPDAPVKAQSEPANPELTNRNPLTIENRLSRLSKALQERAQQLPVEENSVTDPLVAGWADGRDGTAWLNGRRGGGWGDGRDGAWLNGRQGGWIDGRDGGFANAHPWRNGWRDRGSFNNWRNGWRRR